MATYPGLSGFDFPWLKDLFKNTGAVNPWAMGPGSTEAMYGRGTPQLPQTTAPFPTAADPTVTGLNPGSQPGTLKGDLYINGELWKPGQGIIGEAPGLGYSYAPGVGPTPGYGQPPATTPPAATLPPGLQRVAGTGPVTSKGVQTGLAAGKTMNEILFGFGGGIKGMENMGPGGYTQDPTTGAITKLGGSYVPPKAVVPGSKEWFESLKNRPPAMGYGQGDPMAYWKNLSAGLGKVPGVKRSIAA